ncbi:PT domain-containing protein [Paenibacillus sp. CF384]|uniref:PT domain-containing protein n=1 Tax=Paenibacillus sp. CF384 TaxID=1884382 RepID=UPI00115FBDE3
MVCRAPLAKVLTPSPRPNPPTHQPTNPPTHQPTNPPTHQPTNLPTCAPCQIGSTFINISV